MGGADRASGYDNHDRRSEFWAGRLEIRLADTGTISPTAGQAATRTIARLRVVADTDHVILLEVKLSGSLKLSHPAVHFSVVAEAVADRSSDATTKNILFIGISYLSSKKTGPTLHPLCLIAQV